MFSSGVVGKTKKESSKPVAADQDDYAAAQNGYGVPVQNPNQNGYNPVGQDGYDAYGQPIRNPGFVSGKVRPGEASSIGNGRGNTNVLTITSGSDADYYTGYTDGGANYPSNYPGYDQGASRPSKHGQSGIIVNKNSNGQDDVLLWSNNGRKQSGIAVNNGDAQFYPGNNYNQAVPPNPNYSTQSRVYQSGQKVVGRNGYQTSSIYDSQQQTYISSQRY
ncbi:unnamed protein product [Leptosia nina]|uniref:Uncharacterized protein n=1 Tax=Leptosia nina TaxID=320188 RepID=A0AAV1JQV3_9NEOP